MSKKLNRKLISLDSVRWSLYSEIGYDFSYVEQLVKRNKYIDLYKYNSRFEFELVKGVILNSSNSIIDFGAGHSIIESDSDFEYIRSIMKKRGVTIFLDKKHHTNIDAFHPEENFLNNYFFSSKCNQRLSDIIIVVDKKNKSQILDEAICNLDLFKII
ncbi:MAG: hypothetical protein LBI71_11995 [Enterobacteriaceae bacterium]|nr:hypothetical protein [Enterobacteriaceae bacterium]